MSDYFHDDELEELERQDDGIDPFEGVSEEEKRKVLLTIEQITFSDTSLYCLRGAAVLLDILIFTWVFNSVGAAGGCKGVGPMGALYLLAIVFCCLVSCTAFELKNCKQRVEEQLQAEKEQKAEAELQKRLSGIGTLTITDKVASKRVAARLLLYVGSIFALSIIIFGLGIGLTDSFDSLMRDICAPGWKNFFVFPVSMAVFMSMGPICLVVFAWQGSCLTFNKAGISGEVYNAFQKAENVIDYCAEKNRKTGHIIKRYYDIDIESQPNCIKWTNFKCFSVHRNCIVLWQKEHMQASFLAKLYVKLGWNLCLNQYPLRILGTPAELSELKHMLGQIIPSCCNFLPGEKAIL